MSSGRRMAKADGQYEAYCEKTGRISSGSGTVSVFSERNGLCISGFFTGESAGTVFHYWEKAVSEADQGWRTVYDKRSSTEGDYVRRVSTELFKQSCR